VKAEIWLARCAAALRHLRLTDTLGGDEVGRADDWGMKIACQLIETDRFIGLDPIQPLGSTGE
jgi:hypothetical protein